MPKSVAGSSLYSGEPNVDESGSDRTGIDVELDALKTILSALASLSGKEPQARVVQHAIRYFGLFDSRNGGYYGG